MVNSQFILGVMDQGRLYLLYFIFGRESRGITGGHEYKGDIKQSLSMSSGPSIQLEGHD